MTRRQTALLLVLAAIWGGSYALIKVALDDGMPWAWVAFLRIALGALVIALLAARAVGLRALAARPRWTFLVGAAQIGIPFLLIPWAERHVPSGLAGVLVATAPLFTALLGLRYAPETALDRRGLLGVAVGFVGVVLLFAADLAGHGELVVGGLALVLAALGYGIGSTLSRRTLLGVPPLAVSGASLAWATLIAAVPAAASGGLPTPSLGAALAVAFLGAVGTGIAYLIFFTLVTEIGPSRTMFVTYLAPVFALGYGVAFLDERLTVGAAVGIVLVVGGSLLGRRRRAGRPAASA
ncbi:DMT family transporter [Patulibacter sp. S7RM1-6]